MDTDCAFRQKLSPYALTVVRVILGMIFLMHGSQKVLGAFGGNGLVATVEAMKGMGMPTLVAGLVCFTEFLGAIGLILGALTRLAAFGILCLMTGAIILVHGKNGFFLNWFMTPGVGHGYEYNLALIAMSLSLVLGGPGVLAVDNLFCRKSRRIED